METIRHAYLVDREEINYLRITLESYDGMAVVRTLDPNKAEIEIMISPGCEEIIHKILESLRIKEGLKIVLQPGEDK